MLEPPPLGAAGTVDDVVAGVEEEGGALVVDGDVGGGVVVPGVHVGLGHRCLDAVESEEGAFRCSSFQVATPAAVGASLLRAS